MQEPTASQQIKRLFFVIGLGVVAAIGVSVFFLYFFSPSGSYPISELLINPQVAKGLNYQDNGARYKFDHVEFLHFNDETATWDSKKATLDTYQKLYSLIQADKSEAYPDEAIKNIFYEANPAILTIVVRKEGASGDQVFQEMQISTDNDVYRVKLREEQVRPQWAYFTHPRIYQQILKVFEE